MRITMKTNYDSNINFRAKFINQSTIKVLKNKPIVKNVNFVKIDTSNFNDIDAISKCVQKWKKSDFIGIIAENTAYAYLLKTNNTSVYALTEQNSNFDKLKSELILGLADCTDKRNQTYIRHLQIRPDAMFVNNKSRTICGCGSAILKALKDIYNKICLVSLKDENIKKFYASNGFHPRKDSTNSDFLIWEEKSIGSKIKSFFGY